LVYAWSVFIFQYYSTSIIEKKHVVNATFIKEKRGTTTEESED